MTRLWITSYNQAIGKFSDGVKAHFKETPFLLTLPVLWGDMDSLKHVNNTRFFRYAESKFYFLLEVEEWIF
jgi:hypothetical protein